MRHAGRGQRAQQRMLVFNRGGDPTRSPTPSAALARSSRREPARWCSPATTATPARPHRGRHHAASGCRRPQRQPRKRQCRQPRHAGLQSLRHPTPWPMTSAARGTLNQAGTGTLGAHRRQHLRRRHHDRERRHAASRQAAPAAAWARATSPTPASLAFNRIGNPYTVTNDIDGTGSLTRTAPAHWCSPAPTATAARPPSRPAREVVAINSERQLGTDAVRNSGTLSSTAPAPSRSTTRIAGDGSVAQRHRHQRAYRQQQPTAAAPASTPARSASAATRHGHRYRQAERRPARHLATGPEPVSRQRRSTSRLGQAGAPAAPAPSSLGAHVRAHTCIASAAATRPAPAWTALFRVRRRHDPHRRRHLADGAATATAPPRRHRRCRRHARLRTTTAPATSTGCSVPAPVRRTARCSRKVRRLRRHHHGRRAGWSPGPGTMVLTGNNT